MRCRTVAARRYVGAWLTIVATGALIGFVPGIAAAAPTDVFISEDIEGSSNNKALEIFNGTGAPIDLAAGGYQLDMAFNGDPVSLSIALTGTVAPRDVYVVAQSAASPTILAQADQTNGSGWFKATTRSCSARAARSSTRLASRARTPAPNGAPD